MDKKTSAFVSLLLAAFVFSTTGVVNRLLENKVGVIFQLSARTFLMAIIFLSFDFFTNKFKFIKKKDYLFFIGRGFLVVLDFVSFFVSINNLPLGATLFLFYAGSIAANFVFGSLFLHEKVSIIKAVSLILALAGLIIMFYEGLYELAVWPMILALTSGVCFGLTVSTSKLVDSRYSINQINIFTYGTAFILSLPVLLLSKESLSLALPASTWFYLFLYAAIAVVAFMLTLYGFKYMEAQKASLVLLSEMIFTVSIGLLLYHEVLSFQTVLGGIFILAALALPNLNLRKKLDSF